MNTPKIRFKGFTDDWEQRKLRENLSFLKDGTHGTHKDVEDGPLLLSAKNIKNGTVQWDESDRRISEDEFKSIHANFKLKEGDVLLTIVGSIGETAILNNSEGITFQRSVAFLRPASKIISEFLYSEIQGYKFQKELNERKSTSAQPGIYLSDLGEIPISYPINMDEQVAIGHYFTNIDHLITLHQRKCDETKELKKFMLQKMFPKNGEKNPEIRFEGFTDDWEQRKLGEIALQTYGGGTPKTANEEFWKGNIPWIQSSDLLEERLFNVKPRKYISQEAISKSSTKLVPQNSIAIVTRVGVGKLAFMPFSYATSQDFLSFSELKIEPEFAVYALYKMMRLVSNEVQGTSIKGITKDELLAKEILIPDCEEQKKIGAYLHNLDHLITLHQRKCEKLKELKKFMLQNMFV